MRRGGMARLEPKVDNRRIALRSSDRKGELLPETIKDIAVALVYSLCSPVSCGFDRSVPFASLLYPRVTFSTGTQRRNSDLTLRLSKEWTLGYREIWSKRRPDPGGIPCRCELSAGPARTTSYRMDLETRDECRCSLAAEALRSWGDIETARHRNQHAPNVVARRSSHRPVRSP